MINNPFKTAQITVSEEIRDQLKIMCVKEKVKTIQHLADKIIDGYLTSLKTKVEQGCAVPSLEFTQQPNSGVAFKITESNNTKE